MPGDFPRYKPGAGLVPGVHGGAGPDVDMDPRREAEDDGGGNCQKPVIPAKAGISRGRIRCEIPACAGMTGEVGVCSPVRRQIQPVTLGPDLRAAA